jgi:hypothetical protein
MRAATTAVLLDVLCERRAQDAKFGDQSHRRDGTSLRYAALADFERARCNAAEQTSGKATWRHILLEEVFEALAEVEPANLRTELVQCAAVIVAWVEYLDRRQS